MSQILAHIPPLLLLLVATTSAAMPLSGWPFTIMSVRCDGYYLLRALRCLGYGSFLNLAPVEFGRVAGLHCNPVCGLAG
jgi:hypothetical protein